MNNDTPAISEQKWLETFTSGIAALEAANLKEARNKLELAVELAEQLGMTDSLNHSLLALGDAQRMSGLYGEAEATLKKAIDHSFKRPETNRIPYALCLGGLGRLFIEQNRIDDATQVLEMAVSMLRNHRASAEPEFLIVFLALITCYLQTQEFERADKLSRYTYDLSKSLVGPTDAATVMAMSMCSATAKALGKQRRASILNCQIRTIMEQQDKNGASDELGIASAMLGNLNENGIVNTRPIVFSFGGEEEVIFDRDIPSFGGSTTKKSKKERRAVKSKPSLRIVLDD